MSETTVLQGDCRAVLATLPANSVQCVVTSPPYFGLRSYDGGAAEIGTEQTPAAYVAALVDVFAEVWRVLRDDGVVFLNLGDSYVGRGGFCSTAPSSTSSQSGRYGTQGALVKGGIRPGHGFKPKDLMMIPARVAIALQEWGWTLRSDIIWAKPNPMPESVTDRPTSSHEHVFLLAKQERYFYDSMAIAERAVTGANGSSFLTGKTGVNGAGRNSLAPREDKATRNRRNVWTINTEPTPFAHFATMPQKIVELCILAGTSAAGCCPACGAPYARVVERGDLVASGPNGLAVKPRSSNRIPGAQQLELRPKDGYGDLPKRERTTVGWQPVCACNAGQPIPCTVLDPFAGSGTTLRVAVKHGRNAVGIELNETYATDLTRERLTGVPVMLPWDSAQEATGR